MVQFKKSPLEPREPPLGEDVLPEAEVWIMPTTGEAFVNYEEYLRKLDYYRQRSFTCEITGHGRLTFFDAVKSEKDGTLAMESTFPQALRKPVLTAVQFQTIARLDDLVTFLYEKFKEDYHVGETVNLITGDTGERLTGEVRSKTSFAAQHGQPPITRYFLSLPQGDAHEEEKTALMDSDHVFRDRRSFTKQILRSFLRFAIERENYDGAPWTVKEKFAQDYKIDTKVPRYLTHATISAFRKATQSLTKSKCEIDRLTPQFFEGFEEMARQIVEHKGKMPTELITRYVQTYKAVMDPKSVPTHPVSIAMRPSSKEAKLASAADRPAPPPAPPPEPKYPREDFEVKPKRGLGVRPPLSFQQQDQLELDPVENLQRIQDLSNSSIGMALSIWSTLNIHSKYFLMDSFSYDDFTQAMLFTSADSMPELFNEVHCAVLKALVNKDGDVEAVIPALSDTSSSASTSADQSESSTPAPEARHNEPDPAGKDTRASSELSEPEESQVNGLANGHVTNNVRTLLGEYDWKTRIKDRAFEFGGWQTIMAGLMHHLAQTGWVDDSPSKVAAAIAPSDQAVSQDLARQRYADLDANLRLGALQAAVMLASTGKSFKERMEERGLQQTTDRKDKTEAQRRRKPLIEELQQLDIQRKLQRPEEPTDSVTNGVHPEEDPMDLDNSEPDVGKEAEDEDDSDSEPMRGRRRSGRASDLKRKHEQLEKQREARIAELKQAEVSSERAAYNKILIDIETKRAEIRECEEEVIVVDSKLRENSCHRTRCLGVDRFCNRYWWFERNGMPFAGHEDSSTADNGYMNGRLWVQGPGVLEREGFFNLDETDAAHYRTMSGSTPSERRAIEQGSTALECETDWGYYSEPEALDTLMDWLDERGRRERGLLKELTKWRADINATMTARNAYLERLVQKRRQAGEDSGVGVATRKKAYGESNRAMYPCLVWTNGEAERILGHVHSESQGRVKVRGVARPRAIGGFTAVNHVLPGKRETRRGTKY